MRDDLMSKQIEIHPFCAASSFRASKHARVESARGSEIVDRKCNMKRGQGHRTILMTYR